LEVTSGKDKMLQKISTIKKKKKDLALVVATTLFPFSEIKPTS
jgi:hypothetical protein